MYRLFQAFAAAFLWTTLSLPAFCAGKAVLRIAGSNTMLPAARVWADTFESIHPDINTGVRGGGTGVGLELLLAGKCDVACASYPATAEEKRIAKQIRMKLRVTKVARDSLAILVSPSNRIEHLTLAQCHSIFTGATTNWKQLGGRDLGIVMLGRDSDSGTQRYLRNKILAGRRFRRDILRMPTNLAVCQTVSRRVGAIGYAGAGYAQGYAAANKLRIVPIVGKSGSGVMPTSLTTKDGSYPLSRFLYIYTTDKPQPMVKEFLRFVLSPEGQNLAAEGGLVPL